MRQIRQHGRTRRNPARALRVVCRIIQTRKTYGYNSVLERIFRYFTAAAPGHARSAEPRRRMLVERY